MHTHVLAVKPLIWVEAVVEPHSNSRIEYMIKTKSQFKSRSIANNVEIIIPVPRDVDTPSFKASIGAIPSVLLMLCRAVWCGVVWCGVISTLPSCICKIFSSPSLSLFTILITVHFPPPTVGTVTYFPDRDAIIWSIKQYSGSKEYLMRAHFGLPSITGTLEHVRCIKAFNPYIPLLGLSRVCLHFFHFTTNVRSCT